MNVIFNGRDSLKTGKEIITEYCSQFSTASVEHIENAFENKRLIEQGRYGELNGCPSSYGLDDYVGLCETEDVVGTKAQLEQCEKCWRKALNVEDDQT